VSLPSRKLLRGADERLPSVPARVHIAIALHWKHS
jgi:hypothetical protein